MTITLTRPQRYGAAAAVFASSVLMLAGCSAGGATYDFTQINGMEPASALTIQVPEALTKAASAEKGTLLVSSFAVKPHALDSVDFCAIDIEITYAGKDAVKQLTQPEYTQKEADAAIKDNQAMFLESRSVSSVDELEQDLLEDVDNNARDGSGSMWGPDTPEEYLEEKFGTTDRNVVAAKFLLDEASSYEIEDQFSSSEAQANLTVQQVVDAVNDAIEEREQAKVDEAAAVPDIERIASPLGLGSPAPLSDLDEKNPEHGSYISEDLTKVTRVQDCAASPTDQDAVMELNFAKRVSNGITSFATVKLAVMKDDKLSVVEGHVVGYMIDANGDWISG